MDWYYFNNRPDKQGYHEIHKDSCVFFKHLTSRTLLGYSASPEEALTKASLENPQLKFDGCFFCCPTIHKH